MGLQGSELQGCILTYSRLKGALMGLQGFHHNICLSSSCNH